MTGAVEEWAKYGISFGVLLLAACDNLSGVSNNIMPRSPPQYAMLAQPPAFFSQPEQWQPGSHAYYWYASDKTQTLDQMIAPARPVQVAELPRVQILPGRSSDYDVPVVVARDDAHYRALAIIRKEIPPDRRIIIPELSGDGDDSAVVVRRREHAASGSIRPHSHKAEYTSALYDRRGTDLLDLDNANLFDPRVERNRAGVHLATFYPELTARSRSTLN